MNNTSKVNGLEFMVDGNAQPCVPNITPANITHQTNNNCQQFFGPVTGCVFAMPGANVCPPSAPAPKPRAQKKSSTLPDVSAAKVKKAKQTHKAPRELMTFRSCGVHDQCLQLLYQQMIKDGWIGEATLENDFYELFSGQRSEGTVIWLGKYGKGTLVFLFRYMEMENLITIESGFTLPHILMGHFVDVKGQFLTNLDNGDPASDKAGKEVQDYIRILKFNPARAIRKRAVDDDDIFTGFGEGYDSFDHQDLHLHNKRGF